MDRSRDALDLMRAGRALAEGRLAELECLLVGLNEHAENLDRANDGQAVFERAAWSAYGAALVRARGKLEVLADLEVDQQSVLASPASPHGPYFLIGSAELYARTG